MSNVEDRAYNERIAHLIDALAHAITIGGKAIVLAQELGKDDGLSIEKMKLDLQSICTALEQQIIIARSLLK